MKLNDLKMKLNDLKMKLNDLKNNVMLTPLV